MGSCVLHPGRAAQLRGDRICLSMKTCANLLVMHFVKIFRHVSSSVIGLVIWRLFSHAFGLGIGYMLPFFHSIGDFPDVRILLKSEIRYLSAVGPNFLNAM